MFGFLKIHKTFITLAKSRAIINRRLRYQEAKTSSVENNIELSLGMTTLFGLSLLDTLIKRNIVTVDEAISICHEANAGFTERDMPPADGLVGHGPWSSVAAELSRRSAAR